MKFRGASEVQFLGGKAEERAIALAVEAHAGQERKDGSPYILHPLRVMNVFADEPGVPGKILRCAAVLHDVCEDCGVPLTTIRDLVGAPIVPVVDALTRRTDEVYSEYIARASANEYARRIKIADAEDNLKGLDRLADIEEARSLRKRYEWTLSVLK